MTRNIFSELRAYGFGSQRVIPSLDGLRAVSILLVLIAHVRGTRNFPWGSPETPLGTFGVRIFFVISGFLITSILLRELQQSGSISLPRFYFRRTLRLFPASYFLIVVVGVLASWGIVQLAPWDLAFAATYTMNFYTNRGWSLGHLWSLAVEEQFYLLWPLTLRTMGAGRATRFLIGTLLAAPLLRLASPLVGPAFSFLVWSDALATGCLLALLRQDLAANSIYSRLLVSRWFFLVPSVAVLANYIPSTKIQWLCGETIVNLAIAASTDWAMRNPDGIVGRLLNWPPISFMGVLSYSLYLWQQMFLNRYSSSPYCSFPLNILLAFLAALASYLFIECPFLRMRLKREPTTGQRAAMNDLQPTAPRSF